MKLRWQGVVALGLVLAATVLSGIYVSTEVALAIAVTGPIAQQLPAWLGRKGAQ